MARPDETPRDLLFGLLALQNGLITQGELVAAFQAWAADGGRSIADLLADRGALNPAKRALIEGLAVLLLERHGGDVEKSLAALGPDRSTQRSLAGVGDPELTATIARFSATSPEPALARADGDPATASFGQATSDGRRFRVLRPHAQGGLGVVSVALDGELNREVALKEILGHHADDPTSRARFLLEAEITGGLEHPGIVPVYGLGAYGDGRPYYAMRFIRGDSLKGAIAAFHSGQTAGNREVAFRDLLRRFVAACHAIDYAHGRGILHRDIKPGNIIVGKHGETLVVDWGLAKPMGHAEPSMPLDERTLVPSSSSGSAETLPGSALGTPGYMSPEQAAGDLDRLGPRSDVYSLGATLYCLLAGRPPFEGTDLGEVLRRVREGRFQAPRSVVPTVSPALEAICLKAMAFDPAARYASARALAGDLDRWAADEPISARRDPASARLARWARKHRTAVAIAAGVLQTAVVVLAVATVLLGQSRDRIGRESRAASLARDRAEAVKTFLVDDLLKQADPNNQRVGDELTVRQLLDKAAASVDADSTLVGRPEVEGAIRSAIGITYLGLGLYDRAEPQLAKAYELQKSPAEVTPRERIATRNRLNWVRYRQGLFDQVRESMNQAWLQSVEWLGPEDEETLYAADCLAALDLTQMHFDQSITLYRKNLEARRRLLGPRNKLTLRSGFNLACALLNQYDGQGNAAEAEELLRANVEQFPLVLGPDNSEVLFSAISLGLALTRRGKFEEALAQLLPLQERVVRTFGPDHVALGDLEENIGLAEEGSGRLDAARERLTRSLAIRRRAMKDRQPFVRRNLAYLARVDLEQGRTADAASRFLVDPEWFKSNAPTLAMLDAALGPRGGPSPDRALREKAYREVRIQFGAGSWVTGHLGTLHAEALLEQGKAAEAGKLIGPSLAAMEADPKTPPAYLVEARARAARVKEGRPAPR